MKLDALADGELPGHIIDLLPFAHHRRGKLTPLGIFEPITTHDRIVDIAHDPKRIGGVPIDRLKAAVEPVNGDHYIGSVGLLGGSAAPDQSCGDHRKRRH